MYYRARLGAVTIATFLNIGLLVYIAFYFLAKPIGEWYTISDYRDLTTGLALAAHLGTCIGTILLSPFAILVSMRRSPPAWIDKIYASLALAAACTGVCLFLRRTSASGSLGDIAYLFMVFFVIYGSVQLWNIPRRYYTIANREQKRHREHRVHALFWTLFGATLFRLLLLPVMIQEWIQRPIFTDYIQFIIYLTITTWLNLLPLAVYSICRCGRKCYRRSCGRDEDDTENGLRADDAGAPYYRSLAEEDADDTRVTMLHNVIDISGPVDINTPAYNPRPTLV